MPVQPTLPPEWWHWDLSNALSAAQLVLTVLGFVIAVGQLVRTARATEGAREDLEKLRIRMVGNDVMIVVPDLHALEDSMVEVMKTGDGEAAEAELMKYVRKAGDVLGALDSEESLKEDALAKALRQAVQSCQKAKVELVEGSTRPLREVMSTPLRRIGVVSHEASALRARLQRRAD